MTPLAHFEAIWERCDHLVAIHAYLEENVAPALKIDDLLRAEWAARVSALDLYVHELVAQRMMDIFEGRRPPSPGYLRFELSNETVNRIRFASAISEAGAAFDLDVRTQLSIITFQDPDKIADGIRLCSDIELWNDVAVKLGATDATKYQKAKDIRKDISLIVRRRNKIVHEGDLQPLPPRVAWPISRADVSFVKDKIEEVVKAINSLI